MDAEKYFKVKDELQETEYGGMVLGKEIRVYINGRTPICVNYFNKKDMRVVAIGVEGITIASSSDKDAEYYCIMWHKIDWIMGESNRVC